MCEDNIHGIKRGMKVKVRGNSSIVYTVSHFLDRFTVTLEYYVDGQPYFGGTMDTSCLTKVKD